MSSRRPARHRGIRGLGTIGLILSLVHTPLPQPDFHNIRHHDGPGEVCEHHDHLLRWHPGAGCAADVAVLHWHWFLPSSEPLDQAPGAAGPSAHAHVVDWQASSWNERPLVSADARSTSRIAAPSTVSPGPVVLNLPPCSVASNGPPRPSRVRSFGATFAPITPLACLLQRWVC
jgi:hypothetical protein